ncbi:MAG: carboxylating nicotinate-nucleotide diphosphorylase [Candidatus Heimdallarchaeota archaeon]|nr:carboxylating nicotinate-nucleotide diphosphorylase [Candidatus Heimdallarchaeota archaeon]MCK4955130.1 carboxylating nicotinate-nucleotide diphosphorylase [Candidatus Heimdallarchaeota archaeon]
MIPQTVIDQDIKKWIAEDISYWDVTANLLPAAQAKGKIFTKQEGIIAGLNIFKRVFDLLGTQVDLLVEEGNIVKNKTPVATVKGPIANLLQGERLALNLLGRMSGIATHTAKMIDVVKKSNPSIRICATRKTVPGLGKYDKYSVVLGGGDTHRFNLSDMVLLKENHLKMFKSITESITLAKAKTSFSKKIEIEVQNEEQALEASEAGADIIMLDNFSPVQAKLTISKIREINANILIELSGNINIGNIENYVIDGVDLISSGSLTHSVRNFDFTMLIE